MGCNTNAKIARLWLWWNAGLIAVILLVLNSDLIRATGWRYIDSARTQRKTQPVLMKLVHRLFA
jgi:hypothetical protein